ncbi:hypothetical protein WJX74_002788 [Apatococcus lobatus]|uniref:Uncharacterized protein n=1 Tax=Apatococcus lobatus TaxID=904363 RepID=A0AAW1S701_9CHLO
MDLWQHLLKRPSATPDEGLEDLESILKAPPPALEAPLQSIPPGATHTSEKEQHTSAAASSASPTAGGSSAEQHERPASASSRAAQATSYGLLPDPRSFMGQLQQQGEGIYRVATRWQSLAPWSRRPASSASLASLAQQDSHATPEIQLQQQGSVTVGNSETEALLEGDVGTCHGGCEKKWPEAASCGSDVPHDAAGPSRSVGLKPEEASALCRSAVDASQAAQLVQAWLDPRGWHRSTVAASVVGAAAGGAMAGPMGMSLGAKTGVLAVAAGGALAGAAQQYCKTGTWNAPVLRPPHEDPLAPGELGQHVARPAEQP